MACRFVNNSARVRYKLPSPMKRASLPLAIFVTTALVYVALLGQRALGPTTDNHFVHLAHSFLEGQLGVVGNRPPGTNDWALYKGTWFVSFPPFPALVIAPAVAIWGLATRDALFWAVLAGLAPALLFVLLRRLSEQGESGRSLRENLTLTALFAFGTVYFFVAVQGTVWFAAQVVVSALLVLYLLASFDCRRPLLAGLCLGLLWATRPNTILMSWPVFAIEALRTYRRSTAPAVDDAAHPLVRAVQWLRGADYRPVLRAYVLFALPVVVIGGLQLWFNHARFDDPFVFGHEYLQIRWRSRIETWGLFNFHYFSKNLAIFVASLPWISEQRPYVTISLHGLALWFTTPNLLWLFWPKRFDARMVGLAISAAGLAIIDLCYQNSGWIQFGYRFALDYMPLLVALLALGRRRFGPGFYACLVFAVAVNLFGAITFDRHWRFYDNDRTQNRLFQPD